MNFMKKSLTALGAFPLILLAACTRHDGSTDYAYVVPTDMSQTILRFAVDRDTGLFSAHPTIAVTGSGSQVFQQLTFGMVNGTRYAYATDTINGAVYQCSISADGTFSNCITATASVNFGQPRAVSFATFDAQYAYVPDPDNVVVYQCALDASGAFTACASYTTLPIAAPYGMAFATDGSGNQQSYIADAGLGGAGNYGDILLCSMQSDGSFNSCNQTPAAGAPDWVPYAITFATFSGTQYAYVADNGSGSPGHVYRCTLNSDGTFVNSGCTQTPANDSSLTNWYPVEVSFQTLHESHYAYVTNNAGSIGSIYRCSVDSTGLLADCMQTPDTPPTSWLPLGIAF